MIKFEWDEEKNKENQQKHNISFEIARKAFLDPHRLIYQDVKHSTNSEKRWFCIGDIQGDTQNIITVRFTIRGQKIRIFGAGHWRKNKTEYLQHKGA